METVLAVVEAYGSDKVQVERPSASTKVGVIRSAPSFIPVAYDQCPGTDPLYVGTSIAAFILDPEKSGDRDLSYTAVSVVSLRVWKNRFRTTPTDEQS